MYRQKKRAILILLLLIATVCMVIPASAGLFEWSRLGRLIPQAGFEPVVSVVASHPTNSAILYVGTLRSTDNANLVFKSANGGGAWQPASGNLPANLPQNTGVHDLVVAPNNGSMLYAGLFEAGVWISANGGQSWTNGTNGSIVANDTVHALAINPAQPATIFALTSTGVHRSVNSGDWASRSAGLPAPSATIFNDLVAASGQLFVATNPQGVFHSANDGNSWQPANDGLPGPDRNVKGLAISPMSGLLIASVAGQGLWRSDDNGQSWVRSDSGITYNTTLSGNVGLPIFSLVNDKVAYVYNNDGVFTSTDGGQTWRLFNDGFTGAETVTTLAFNEAAPDTVYAGTSVSGTWSLTAVAGGRFYVPVVIR